MRAKSGLIWHHEGPGDLEESSLGKVGAQKPAGLGIREVLGGHGRGNV